MDNADTCICFITIEKNKPRDRLESAVKLKKCTIKDFKRFTSLTIQNIPQTAHLVILVGPNGCGKSSFFDALYAWYRMESGKSMGWQNDYHSKSNSPLQEFLNTFTVEFHDLRPEEKHKMLYVRTAYRNDPEFTMRKIERDVNPVSRVSFERMIDNDMAVSQNYKKLVSQGLEDLYTKKEEQTTFAQYRKESIGEIRETLCKLFPDLKMNSLGNPLDNGTFRFTKGTSDGFMFKNLSGGEKATFDLILDLIVARQNYNNTLFCIDEPESHIHTSLHANLLSVLNELVPENCQLVLATHSIGMIRQARDIENEKPGSVVFLDFGRCDFDVPQTIEPATPNRKFWKNAYDVALGDLSGLIAPDQVIMCEGEPLTDSTVRNRSFDARCYERIFEDEFPETEFISMGGNHQVIADKQDLAKTLSQIVGAIKVMKLVDRDDRTDEGIEDLNRQGVRVLSRRNLESYLFDDEVLTNLAIANGKDDCIDKILKEKCKILADMHGRAQDNLKPVRRELCDACKKILELTHSGNDAVEFMRDTLAPLIKPETKVYDELKQDIFGKTTAIKRK